MRRYALVTSQRKQRSDARSTPGSDQGRCDRSRHEYSGDRKEGHRVARLNPEEE